MLKFTLGFVLGAVTFGAVFVYADVGVLFNSSNQEVGTTNNPIYIEVVS